MTNDQTEYSNYEYNALGYFLKQQMYGVELTEQEKIEAAMAILKFGEIEIPEVEDELQQIKIQDKYGIISKDGWIAFPIYRWIGYFKEGFAWVERLDRKRNHINTKGETISKEWWKDVGDFKGGFAKVQRLDGTHNFINTKGEPISDEWWEDAWDFYEGFSYVKKENGTIGYIDTKGNFYDKFPK